MLARLRSLRWVGVLLVVLSPPAAGTLLPVLHPCPVDAPWLAGQDTGTPDRGSEHAGHERADDPAGHGTCHCIGSCEAGVGPAALGAAATPGLLLRDTVRGLPVLTQSAPAATLRPWYSQPPATAPPLA
jgi:hypothetical protein